MNPEKPKALTWEESASYGLTYFTAYRMLIDQCGLQAGHRVLIWGAAGGLGVFATQLCEITGATSVGVVSSDEKGELIRKLGAEGHINRGEFAGMMRRGDETSIRRKPASTSPGGSARWSRRCPATARHRLRARRQGHVPDLGVRRQAVRKGRHLRAARRGINLDFDVRYLWMRQKEIIGSHFANA